MTRHPNILAPFFRSNQKYFLYVHVSQYDPNKRGGIFFCTYHLGILKLPKCESTKIFKSLLLLSNSPNANKSRSKSEENGFDNNKMHELSK